MRLSIREANVPALLTKAPVQRDWQELLASDESWPPLLPSFSKETVEALDRFVQASICKRIEFRCGQLSPAQYSESFLPQWIAMAERRTAKMEDFFAQQGTRLSEEVFQTVFGGFERLQCALRDARQERGGTEDVRHDKKISFARPVAHRLIRRSRDRFSLRSIADPDESRESSLRLSTSPCPPEVIAGLRDSLQRGSLSPLPFLDPLQDLGEECTLVLPVAENAEEEHFTGRVSGVYYGNVVHSAAAAPSSDELDGAVDGVSAAAATRDSQMDGVGERVVDASHFDFAEASRRPVIVSAAWRRWWIRVFYYVLLPCAVVLFLSRERVLGLMMR